MDTWLRAMAPPSRPVMTALSTSACRLTVRVDTPSAAAAPSSLAHRHQPQAEGGAQHDGRDHAREDGQRRDHLEGDRPVGDGGERDGQPPALAGPRPGHHPGLGDQRHGGGADGEVDPGQAQQRIGQQPRERTGEHPTEQQGGRPRRARLQHDHRQRVSPGTDEDRVTERQLAGDATDEVPRLGDPDPQEQVEQDLLRSAGHVPRQQEQDHQEDGPAGQAEPPATGRSDHAGTFFRSRRTDEPARPHQEQDEQEHVHRDRRVDRRGQPADRRGDDADQDAARRACRAPSRRRR